MSDFRPWYRNYVLGVLAFAYLLNAFDRSILGILLEPIKLEFGVSDTALGLLGGIAFAAFYSTLGIPIALWADRSNRRNILALAILVWSAMTAFCGLAPTFMLLLLARIGTAVGEAGGSPPSHALISDYFTPQRRGTALAIFALGAPMGATLGSLLGGLGNELFGWRITFILAGLPGLLLAPLVWLTIVEPRAAKQHKESAPPFADVAAYLWQRRSYIHLCLGCALHATAVYGTAAFNASFLIRSHGWNTADIGQLLGFVGVAGILGTFIGGVIADRCSVRWNDPRWYVWVCGLSSLLMAPAVLLTYLSNSVPMMIAAFLMGGFLSSVFFGPSVAATQALAASRMRAVTSSILIFVKTMLGMGLGPFLIGRASDLLSPGLGVHSLRYALLAAAVFNIWAAWHFFASARHLRKDLGSSAGVRSEPALQPHTA
jgi:predicted MFS family arabinose efflux permease